MLHREQVTATNTLKICSYFDCGFHGFGARPIQLSHWAGQLHSKHAFHVFFSMTFLLEIHYFKGRTKGSRHQCQANAAREYLDKHNLVEFTQLLVQSVS